MKNWISPMKHLWAGIKTSMVIAQWRTQIATSNSCFGLCLRSQNVTLKQKYSERSKNCFDFENGTHCVSKYKEYDNLIFQIGISSWWWVHYQNSYGGRNLRPPIKLKTLYTSTEISLEITICDIQNGNRIYLSSLQMNTAKSILKLISSIWDNFTRHLRKVKHCVTNYHGLFIS